MGKYHSKNLQLLEKKIIYENIIKYEVSPSTYTNNIIFCDICYIININKYNTIHCNLCNTCHFKNKLFCISCKECYNPLLDSDLILHKKQCIKIRNYH